MKIKAINREKREKDIEALLCREVKKLGGVAYKFTSPGRRSAPDRLCVFPNGLAVFVECKRPGQEPTALQWDEIMELRARGHLATWVQGGFSVKRVIAQIDTLLSGLAIGHPLEAMKKGVFQSEGPGE